MMRRESNFDMVHIEANNKASYWYCLFMLLIVGILCIPCAVFLLWTPDERLNMINKYNEQASIWNNTYLYEMMNSSFALTVDKSRFSEQINTNSTGEFYPYRDSCSKRNDPTCFSPPVYYKSFSIPSHISFNPNIVLKSSSAIILNTTIPFVKNITLTPSQLNCNIEGDICSKRCNAFEGYWLSDYNICVIQSYLNRVCMRVRKDPSSNVLVLDNETPLYPMNVNSDVGCEKSLAGNTLLLSEQVSWLPYLYTHHYSKDISFILYHAGDAYIRAGAITDNCSSSHQEDANCFLRGRSDYLIWIILFLIFGLISIISIVAIAILYKKGTISFAFWPELLDDVSRLTMVIEEDDSKPKPENGYPEVECTPCDNPTEVLITSAPTCI